MWGISFDFKATSAKNALSYPNKCLFYNEIREALELNGFKYKQRSVYESKHGLSHVYKAVEALKNLPFKQYFKNVLVFKLDNGFDFTDIVTK